MGLFGFFWPLHWIGLGVFGLVGSFFRLIVIAGVVVGVVVVVRSLNRNIGAQRETPLEILRRRYANGEISKEEYEQRLKDLG